MNENFNNFMESLKNENIDSINDLLIEASISKDKKYLIYVDYLIEKANKSLLEKVKLSIIYFLGEIGKVNILENRYLGYLIQTYYNSDRWVRNEIIQSLAKIANNHEVSSEVFDILAYAVLEDYTPTKINALKLLKMLKNVPKNILKNLMKVIDTSNSEVIEYSIQILKDHIKNDHGLFNLLNATGNYLLLTKNSFRTLLIEFFDSINNLENFREQILHADWNEKYKSLFFKEIESYQRILLSRYKF